MLKGTDNILVDFFQAFRVALFNSSIYSSGHSVAQKSLEDLKRKIDIVLSAQPDFTLMVAPKYLLINEQKFEKDSLYEDLATFLHHRSIKSIKFQSGVALEELDFFLAKASLRIRDILKEGGLEKILQARNIARIRIEMLDYSQILKDGKEEKDVWVFLLRKAVDDQNSEAIQALIDSFNKMIGGVGVTEVLSNQELQDNVSQFLNYLSDKQDVAFVRCAQMLFRIFLRGRFVIKDAVIPPNLIKIFQSVTAVDLAQVLIEELSVGPVMDVTILESVNLLIEGGKHDALASALMEKIRKNPSSQFNAARLTKWIDDLSRSNQPAIRDVYHPIFAAALGNMNAGNVLNFDQEALPDHLYGVLFFLLEKEARPTWRSLVVDKFLETVQRVHEEKRIPFYRQMIVVVEKTPAAPEVQENILRRIHYELAGYVERSVLEGESRPELEDLLKTLKVGRVGVEQYLIKIFREDKVTVDILGLFLNLFPTHIQAFQQNLNRRLTDTRFVLRFLECAPKLPPPQTLIVLKSIFMAPNAYIRTEALSLMSALPVMDKEFLLNLLRNKSVDINQKEVALLMVKDDGPSAAQAVEILLPLSGKEDVASLKERVELVGSAKLSAARQRLQELQQRTPFWQGSLREAIAKSLEQIKHG